MIKTELMSTLGQGDMFSPFRAKDAKYCEKIVCLAFFTIFGGKVKTISFDVKSNIFRYS